MKTAATSDEMVTLMNEGGFDLVTASGDASNRLIAGGKVQPINTELIPSWSTVDERLQSAPWNTVDGVHYGVPYQWGPTVLMYKTEVFPEAPTSWAVTFEETTLSDGQSNKGRVQAYDGAIYMADAALYLKAHNPELGIDNPYDLNQAQFDAVVALLTSQRDLINRYWHDAYGQMDDFKTDGVDLGLRFGAGRWPGMKAIELLREEVYPVCSPAFQRKHRLRRPEDLGRVPLLRNTNQPWVPWFRSVGLDWQEPSRGTIYDDSLTALRAASEGHGVALARGILVAEEVRGGQLCRLFPGGVPVDWAYYAVYLGEGAAPRHVQPFLDWLVAEAAAHQAPRATRGGRAKRARPG